MSLSASVKPQLLNLTGGSNRFVDCGAVAPTAPYLWLMDTSLDELPKDKGSFAVLWRFLPMLWPKDDAALRVRVLIIRIPERNPLLVPGDYPCGLERTTA